MESEQKQNENIGEKENRHFHANGLNDKNLNVLEKGERTERKEKKNSPLQEIGLNYKVAEWNIYGVEYILVWNIYTKCGVEYGVEYIRNMVWNIYTEWNIYIW